MIKICDTREPIQIREKLLELGWGQTALKDGDYTFNTIRGLRVGIERRTTDELSDLLQMKDRFQRLISAYDIPIGLIEGKWDRQSDDTIPSARGLTWRTIWNMVQSFQDMGLRIQLTTSPSHTISRLNELYAYFQSPEHRSPFPRKFSTDPRLLSLSLIPGVSRSTAASLLGRFGDLQSISRASVDELQSVAGVGPSRAKSIYDFFR